MYNSEFRYMKYFYFQQLLDGMHLVDTACFWTGNLNEKPSILHHRLVIVYPAMQAYFSGRALSCLAVSSKRKVGERKKCYQGGWR